MSNLPIYGVPIEIIHILKLKPLNREVSKRGYFSLDLSDGDGFSESNTKMPFAGFLLERPAQVKNPSKEMNCVQEDCK